MTTTLGDREKPGPITFADLKATFGTAIEDIRAGAARRELDRELPVGPIGELVELGFPRLRVPAEFGGLDAPLDAVVELFVDIASADPNVAQALRGHFAFVELLRESPAGEFRDHWLGVIGRGALFGNAESEKTGAYGDPLTFVDERESDDGPRFVLNGTKYYTTGTYFADFTWTTAVLRGRGGTEKLVSLPVDLRADGVEVVDDWNGFGQRLTASGTTSYRDVEVDPRWIVPRGDAPSLVWSVLQLNLLAGLVGTAEAAVRDIADLARSSSRNAWNPAVERRRDPAAIQAVGEARARTLLLRGALLDAARRVDRAGATVRAAVARGAGSADTLAAGEFNDVDAVVAALWVTATEQALQVTSGVFDAIGASATQRERALDRHWRNARTIASNNPVHLATAALGDHELNGVPVGARIHDALQPSRTRGHPPAEVPA